MRARRASAQPPLRGLPRGRGEDESMSRARSRSPWAWPGGQRLRLLLKPGRHVDEELGGVGLGHGGAGGGSFLRPPPPGGGGLPLALLHRGGNLEHLLVGWVCPPG